MLISHYTCAALLLHLSASVLAFTKYRTSSGLREWVDSSTPQKHKLYTTSRGEKWELVMSDEYNKPGRSFKPGHDHMWTSLEKPDGVNNALELYSHNMTSTTCDKNGKTCYFQIKIIDEVNTIRVWNNYQTKPGYQNVSFYYRAGMVQSWNKFCFQGGLLEVRAQLPGVVSEESGNPDIAEGPHSRVKTIMYYPTWPGIWMLGNLGRAIFTASTNRIWPFSYSECDDSVFNSTNQRISACDDNPGHGLNPNQGRGAPEIDVLEGAADLVSASVQIGPGMPKNFRRYGDGNDCVYTASCKMLGGNDIEVPSSVYVEKRGHRSWYQGLKYAANNLCKSGKKEKQDISQIIKSVEQGLSVTKCDSDVCPASYDVNGDLSIMRKKSPDRWGINSNGTCFSKLNPYFGAFLCNPGSKNEYCEDQGLKLPENKNIKQFAYQMDAISANWHLHVGAYTGYVKYQIEWVMGDTGYVRWSLEGQPLYEIPAESITEVPQDSAKSNPRKIMVEEPMYIIYNVALSAKWRAAPPNAGVGPCRGNGSNVTVNRICDAFPLYMKIDYIRLYQDTGKNSSMTTECDPSTHPTKKWIDDHIDEYEDSENLWIPEDILDTVWMDGADAPHHHGVAQDA
uniref:Betaglucan synthesisassociated protein putative n=1 Tax=Albugo laibachii Nc14 TaxID=890382 RepID=F0WXJ3_9STRA|nr:betaglucan synthesisassociated protein putative [Albugo laibachii Nc14]|eukprot:CCA26187.1 betaglucan synthesisassociated protein putative [Albugo laibachii Nc14]